jgi:type I restriction enzyme S subunit
LNVLKPYPEYVDRRVDWLGRAPSHWAVGQLKRYARIVNGGTPAPESANWDGDIAWATPVDLNAFDGQRVLQTIRTLTSLGLANGSAAVPPGSVVVSTRAPIGYSAIATQVLAFNQGCKGLVPGRAMSPSYLLYTMQAARQELSLRGQGTTFVELSTASLGSIPIPAPPMSEQAAVVDFLDRETAEIDAFIADQEQLIELLAERRDAGWQAALDGLKFPDVPLRRVIASIVDGPFGSSLTSAHYSERGARVVRLGNIGINEFKDDDQAFISMAYFAELAAHSIKEGDVVVAGLGDDRMPLGRATVVPDIGPAIVKADCYRLRPGPLVTSEYLAWVLSAPQSRYRMIELSRGSTRQRLNTSVVRDVAIPLPPVGLQSRVVKETRHHSQELDAAITDAREAIALSRERRTALISAAVTGKIDVRGAA